jgi:hypothetical protein
LKLVSTHRKATQFALALTLLLGLVAPALAQKAKNAPANGQFTPFLNQPLLSQAPPAPSRAHPMVGDGTRIPADVPVRSLKGVKGFDRDAAGTSRVRIGGANGANVIEKIVNLTRTDTLDERVPIWSPDERFMYLAASTTLNARYNLFYVAADEPDNVTVPARNPLTNPNETTFDYYFPAINANGNRIAFVRSNDGKSVDDPTKIWNLYVSDLPVPGQFIDTAPLGPTNLRSLTAGRTFPSGTATQGTPDRVPFTNVGRPSWVGANDIVFAGQLQGSPNYHIFTVNVQTGVIFQLTAGPCDERNPAVSPDGRYIAFDSNAQGLVTGEDYLSAPGTANRRVRSETDPLAVPATGQNASTVRNIFTMTTLGADVRQFTARYTGTPTDTNSVEPAWSSLERNNFTNVNGDEYYLAFSSNRIPRFANNDPTQSNIVGFQRGPENTSSIYYVIYTRNRGTTRLIEADPTDLNNTDSDGARRLDSANDTLVGGVLNDVTQPRYNDRYPTWAPIVKVFRIGFQSNRNGSYRANGFGGGFTLTPTALNNILFASVIDITAPTLVRYDTSNPTGEIVHINLVTDQIRPFKPNIADSVRSRDNGITPGSLLHFAVRVEDREAGLRPGSAVYLQFKNPNSKYQSQAQGGNGVEHKEFVGSRFLNLDDGAGPSWIAVSPSFYAFGYEYECQAISAADRTTYFSHNFSNPAGGPLYTPSVDDVAAFSGNDMPPLDGQGGRQNVWLKLEPLVELNDDGTPRLDDNGNTIPIRPADGAGGVLYGASWQIPAEASDWYIDVIAYDNAVNPFDPTDTSNVIIYDNVWGFSSANPISGQQTDVLVIMDYALGQKFFGSRFGQSPAGAINTGNLQPLFFGAESYYTDIDMQLYPQERFPNPAAPPTDPDGMPRPYDTNIGPFNVSPQLTNGAFGGEGAAAVPNVLGVESYIDEFLASSAVVADTSPINGKQYRLPVTGRYNIWRILSRGPVPASVLRDYLPQVTISPADIAVGEQNNRTFQHATRFVVWASPFSGNLFVGPGTITDIQTQNDLENFITNGGRLFISGQDIGWALVGQGQTNRFFSQILKARYISDGVPGEAIGLNAAETTIAGNYIGQLRTDPWDPAGSAAVAFGRFAPPTPFPYQPLSDNSQEGVDLPYQNNWASGPVGDSSPIANSTFARPDVIQANPSTTPAGLPATTPPDSTDEYLWSTTPGQPTLSGPGVAPVAGNHLSAIIAASYPVGTSAIGIFPEYNPNAAFTPQGKVVYASAGFESIGMGWYTAGDPALILTYGQRAKLMFAIGSNMRTGTITGRIIDNDGAPVSDALVRAVPNVANDTVRAAGTAVTDNNGNFQITGLQPGFYVIFGYRAGFYTQHNLGNTVHGGWRSQASVALKKATPGALSGIRQGQNFGGVFAADGITPIDGIEIQVRRLEPTGRYTLVATLSSNGRDPVRLPDGSLESLPAGAYRFPSIAVSDPRFGYQVLANARTTVNEAGEIVEKPTQTFTDANGNQFQARVNFDGTPVKEQYGEVRVGVSDAATFRLGAGTVVIPNAGLPIGPTIQIRESENSQVDFLLPTAPQRVSGQVVDQDNDQPLEGGLVTATLVGTTTLVASGTTDANGNYTLQLVNPPTGTDATLIPGGSYVITANVNGYSTVVPPSEVNGIQLQVGGTLETAITAPQLRLKKLPPGSVSGLVRRFNGLNFATTGVDGATVSFYTVTTVGGTQIQAENPSFTATVAATPTNDNGYLYNFRIESVSPGTYNAYVSKPGLTGSPSPFANVTITTGAETRNVNFNLEPPKIYGQGVQLISVPQDFSAFDTRTVFGLTPDGDNNGDGVINDVDRQIYDVFNVADWTGTQYQIAPTIPLRLGKGYFTRFGATASVGVVGTPTDTETYTIDLSTGWNLIGHPFSNQANISDPAADISIASSAQTTFSYTAPNGQQRLNVPLSQAVNDGAVQQVVYSYTGSNSGGAYIQGGIIKPWFGYWFRAYVPVQMTLRYPGGATRALKASGKGGDKFRSVTTADREAIAERRIESKALNDWRIQIAAMQGDLRDTDNAIGIAQDANDAFDNKYDTEKPPMMTQVKALYVSIAGNDATGRATSFADSIKAANGQKKTWEFTVETTGGNGEVTVYWPNISRLPRGIEPMLVDVATGKRVAMRSVSSFRFAPSGRAQRLFRVEVGPPASLPLDIMNLRSVPSRSLNGVSYRFNFITTRSVEVNAEVKTLTGRTVKRFRTRATGGTETSIVWDGRDERGAQLPPGPYVLSIGARDEEGRLVNRSVPFMSVQ